jgi:hypothetical protein
VTPRPLTTVMIRSHSVTNSLVGAFGGLRDGVGIVVKD